MEHQFAARQCRDDGSIVLNSGERLTIDTAADFANSIRAALAATARLEVAFVADCAVDVTALQTLCSACKTAAAMGKSLLCHGPLPSSLQQLIVAAGAVRPGPCRHNNGEPCPWFGGNS